MELSCVCTMRRPLNVYTACSASMEDGTSCGSGWWAEAQLISHIQRRFGGYFFLLFFAIPISSARECVWECDAWSAQKHRLVCHSNSTTLFLSTQPQTDRRNERHTNFDNETNFNWATELEKVNELHSFESFSFPCGANCQEDVNLRNRFVDDHVAETGTLQTTRLIAVIVNHRRTWANIGFFLIFFLIENTLCAVRNWLPSRQVFAIACCSINR